MANTICATCREDIVPKSGFGQGWKHVRPPADEHEAVPYVYIDPPPKGRYDQVRQPPSRRVPDGFLGC